jgi:hypothetical protein
VNTSTKIRRSIRSTPHVAEVVSVTEKRRGDTEMRMEAVVEVETVSQRRKFNNQAVGSVAIHLLKHLVPLMRMELVVFLLQDSQVNQMDLLLQIPKDLAMV